MSTNTPWLPLRTTYRADRSARPRHRARRAPSRALGRWLRRLVELWLAAPVGAMRRQRSGVRRTRRAAPAASRAFPSRTRRTSTDAPQPPYMRDLVLAHDGVRYPVVAGLAEDYIGYIVPVYNFVLATEWPVAQRGRRRPLRRGVRAVARGRAAHRPPDARAAEVPEVVSGRRRLPTGSARSRRARSVRRWTADRA